MKTNSGVRFVSLIVSVFMSFALTGTARTTGEFLLAQQLQVPAHPWMVAGDFDGSGTTDVAVSGYKDPSDYLSGVIALLLNDGTGALTAGPETPVGYTGPLASGDFNRDGHLDLAVLSVPTRILLGTAGGVFLEGATIAPVRLARMIAGADVSGDGIADILTVGDTRSSAGKLTTVGVSIGRGDGTFVERADYSVPGRLRGFATSDFDGNGSADVAVALAKAVAVFLSTKGGTLEQPATYKPPVWIREPGYESLRVGDVNGDALPDLAIPAHGANSTAVLLNAGAGHFGEVVIPASSEPVGAGIVVGDFDGDGFDDVLSCSSYRPVQSLFRGARSGPQSGQHLSGVGPGSGRVRIVARMNADERVDVLEVKGFQDGFLYVYLSELATAS